LRQHEAQMDRQISGKQKRHRTVTVAFRVEKIVDNFFLDGY
jgi:hypothetical protein